MVNSDLCWTYSIKAHFYDNAFLKFARNWNIPKFVYAASMGTMTWFYSKEDDRMAKILLKDFKGISFREIGTAKMAEEHLCIKSTLLNLPLKGLKIECISGGSESGCCTTNSKLSNLRIYCTDQTLYDLDNSNVQNKPFECIHELKNCVGEESEVEMKVLGLSLDKFKNEAKDELDEANKNGMKPPKSNFQFLIQGFKVLSPIIKISKYFYIFRDFEVSYNVGDDVEVKKENFIQIDWIYSKNFDRIFIGILKNTNTYLNKGIYAIDSIDMCHFETMNKINNFQVVLKNGNSETLCTFKLLPKDKLNDFIILINWQIRKIKNKIGNNFNSEINMITTGQ
jgi:hypothetical protein